ncbi:uncharacterized protein [Halyomorpha halys]|uniref:uncharacterized protein n=1 Tax=Halyomorpha halys TaxID=286706 RepID=UPI0034D323D1
MSDCDLSPQLIELTDTSSGAGKTLRNFIDTYKNHSELWNPTNPYYKNKYRRNAAYDTLLSIYTRLKPGATRADVKRKINTLRCNYRKELNKILSSKRSASNSDEVYKPTSWVFYALQFLGTDEEPVSSYEQGDEILSEQRIQEEEIDEPSTLPVPSASRSSTFPPPFRQKKRRTVEPLGGQNELLQKACTLLEELSEPPDTIPTIAKVWGERLLTLDPQQRAFAEKAVNDILFEAGQGTLHRHSVKINEDLSFGSVLKQPSTNNRYPSTSSENIS